MPPLCHLIEIESAVFSVNDGYSDACFMTRHHTLGWYLIKKAEILTQIWNFLTFLACFLIPIIFSNLNHNCSNSLDLSNLQEQVKQAFCYQKMFWSFTVWINCFCDLTNFANSRPSALNFKSFFRPLKQFFLTVSQNNFCNKIPFPLPSEYWLECIFQDSYGGPINLPKLKL